MTAMSAISKFTCLTLMELVGSGSGSGQRSGGGGEQGSHHRGPRSTRAPVPLDARPCATSPRCPWDPGTPAPWELPSLGELCTLSLPSMAQHLESEGCRAAVS